MSNIIRELLAAGSVTLYCDYRRQDLRDLSPLQRHGTIAGTDVRFSPQGAHFTGSGRIVHPDHVAGRNTTGSVVVLGGPTLATAGSDTLFDARDGGGTRVQIYWAGTTVIQFSTTTGGPFFTPLTNSKGKMCQGFDYLEGAKPKLYLDGLLWGEGSLVNTSITANDAPITIGNNYVGSTPMFHPIACILETNVQLTPDQHAKIYAELSQITYAQRPYCVILPNSLVTHNRRGLVGRWDPGATSANTCPDTSDSGANGTVTGTGNLWVEDSPLGKVARVDGSKAIDCGAFAVAKGASALTISMWAKRTAVTTGGFGAGFFNAAEQRVQLGFTSTGIGFWIATGAQSRGTYGLNDLLWHHLVLRFDGTQADNAGRLRGWIDGQEVVLSYSLTIPATTSVAAANWGVGGLTGALSLGSGGPVSVWNRALDPAEIVQEYRRARPAGYRSDWGVPVSSAARGGVIGTELETTGWRHLDTVGRFFVDTSTISGTPVKTIRCSTYGGLYLPTATMGQSSADAAYGTWSFAFYKVYFGDTYIYQCADEPTLATKLTYIRLFADGRLTCAVTGAILFTAPAGTITPSTWYRYKVSKTSEGYHTVQVLGGVYTQWTTLGTATNNTVTTARYMGMLLGAGDQIALGGLAGENAISKTITI